MTIATLEAVVPGRPVVRAMPNTPALVGRGAAAIAGGSATTRADLDLAASVLGSVGVVVTVPETMLDAVTGLSGSGPAYVFLVAEALIEAGIVAGLPADVAATLANHTLLGAATMLVETGEPAAALRAAVTSPGGTTAAALERLEERNVRAALLDEYTRPPSVRGNWVDDPTPGVAPASEARRRRARARARREEEPAVLTHRDRLKKGGVSGCPHPRIGREEARSSPDAWSPATLGTRTGWNWTMSPWTRCWRPTRPRSVAR